MFSTQGLFDRSGNLSAGVATMPGASRVHPCASNLAHSFIAGCGPLLLMGAAPRLDLLPSKRLSPFPPSEPVRSFSTLRASLPDHLLSHQRDFFSDVRVLRKTPGGHRLSCLGTRLALGVRWRGTRQKTRADVRNCRRTSNSIVALGFASPTYSSVRSLRN